MDDDIGSLFEYNLVLMFIWIGIALYFLPTIIACVRSHHYKWIIFAINLVGGTVGIGYLIALIWSLWPKDTGSLDPFLNDPISNSAESNKRIYGRYRDNLDTLNGRDEVCSNNKKALYCCNCGAPVGMAKFCPQCGAKQNSETIDKS